MNSLEIQKALLFPILLQVTIEMCEEDNGFALSNWTEILFDNSNIIINEDIAIAMGNYTFKNEASKIKVEYSFVYKNYGDEIKIILHHSSLPYKI